MPADIRKKAAANLANLQKGLPLRQKDGSTKVVPVSKGEQIKYDLRRRQNTAGISAKDLG